MPICDEYRLMLEEAVSRKKSIRKFFDKLKQYKNGKLINELFKKYHDEVFRKIDCLKCGNCCSTISPIITDSDIQKISKSIKEKPSLFTEKFLYKDSDQDYVFRQTPCPFLDLKEHYCSVYDSRPKACREYPHTDHKKVTNILNLTFKNVFVCPGVYTIVKKLEKEFM